MSEVRYRRTAACTVTPSVVSGAPTASCRARLQPPEGALEDVLRRLDPEVGRLPTVVHRPRHAAPAEMHLAPENPEAVREERRLRLPAEQRPHLDPHPPRFRVGG